MNNTILEVKNLKTYFYLTEGTLKAVDGVDLNISSRETVSIIGESGCGKSITAASIMQIVFNPGKIYSGEILLKRKNTNSFIDLVKLGSKSREICSIRGRDIAMIFQEPMTSLSPVHTIGNQIVEGILLHITRDKNKAKEIALDMLNKVEISNPSQRFNEYPHQLSGGMRQRAMIAMALACNPSILIADEPTTALDVTIQAQIIDLMERLQQEFGMAMIYITHDLGVVAEIADTVNVMYLGKIMESANTHDIFKNSLHPYTLGLLESIPKLGKKSGEPLKTIEGTVPLPIDLPHQCGFFSRCHKAITGLCNKQIPALVEMEKSHKVRCFLYSKETESRNDK